MGWARYEPGTSVTDLLRTSLHMGMVNMLWKQTEPMTEKERFAVLAQTGRFTVVDCLP
jgi:hypothetical protein